MNSDRKYQLNGSSVHSSRSSSPDVEPVGELPQGAGQMIDFPEERIPTPFPIVQQQLDEAIGGIIPSPLVPLECPLSPLPLQMRIPSTSTLQSPLRHPMLSPQHSIGSSYSGIPPVPLSPSVYIYNPFPLSCSSSDTSLGAMGHLIKRLREDRHENEMTQSRSVASGLYEFANLVMPSLPEYQSPVYEDFDVEEELRRQHHREGTRFFRFMCVATGLIGTAVVGQQLSYLIFDL